VSKCHVKRFYSNVIIVVISHCAIFVPLGYSLYRLIPQPRTIKGCTENGNSGFPFFPLKKPLADLYGVLLYSQLAKPKNLKIDSQADLHAVCLKLVLCCVQFVCGYKLSPLELLFRKMRKFSWEVRGFDSKIRFRWQ